MSTRIPFLLLSGVAACSPPVPSTPSTTAAPVSRPDVLLVSIDSLRADHLGCYGYSKATSPNLDRLAREGVRCEQVVSTTSWTLPAHAALFTGLFDSTHGVVDNERALSEKANTLAEALHAAGYRTAGVFGGPYLHPVFGLAQGFDRWVNCMGAALTAKQGELVKLVLDPAETLSLSDVTGPRTLDETVKLLRELPEDEPLFLFVHLWDVHYDYKPPEEYWRRFDPDWSGTLDARDVPHNPALTAQMPARDLQHLVALYDGEIAFTDDILGRILAVWDEHRGRERSLVVVTSDHGEEFFEHGGKGHQRALFEESVRVPFVARWPGRFDGGRAVRPLVRLIDVAPTILAAAGVAVPAGVQGRDVGPLLRGEPMEPAPALCELLVDGAEIRALRREASKVIRYKDGRLVFALDLARDPGEEAPLATDSTAARLGLADLDRLVREARERGKELGLAPRRIVLDDAVRSALKGLGYVGDDANTAPR
ncbi:MAG: sulfatase [Planctomycetes bacterium]|nr:sulfatase [Planctomycetota bacterium]